MITKGGTPYFENEYVISYNLEYSSDGEVFSAYNFNPIIDPSPDAKDFVGIESLLHPPITTRFLRFIPVDFHNAKTMRIWAIGKS